jgi:hypothetical protein
MGWKSTMGITRGDAMTEIMARLDAASDDALAEILEELVDNEGPTGKGLHGHNFSIITEYPKDQHPEIPYFRRG